MILVVFVDRRHLAGAIVACRWERLTVNEEITQAVTGNPNNENGKNSKYNDDCWHFQEEIKYFAVPV